MSVAEYLRIARPADILLWKPRSVHPLKPWTWGNLWSGYITRYTGGPYSHVTGVVHWERIDEWMSCGYSEGKGGLVESVELAVKRWESGKIDVFRVKPIAWTEATPDCVAAHMGKDLGGSYNWLSIWAIVLPMLPFIGLFTTEHWNSNIVRRASKSRINGICSQHIGRSFALCGLNLIHKPLALVVPSDFAESFATEYLGTLVQE